VFWSNNLDSRDEPWFLNARDALAKEGVLIILVIGEGKFYAAYDVLNERILRASVMHMHRHIHTTHLGHSGSLFYYYAAILNFIGIPCKFNDVEMSIAAATRYASHGKTPTLRDYGTFDNPVILFYSSANIGHAMLKFGLEWSRQSSSGGRTLLDLFSDRLEKEEVWARSILPPRVATSFERRNFELWTNVITDCLNCLIHSPRDLTRHSVEDYYVLLLNMAESRYDNVIAKIHEKNAYEWLTRAILSEDVYFFNLLLYNDALEYVPESEQQFLLERIQGLTKSGPLSKKDLWAEAMYRKLASEISFHRMAQGQVLHTDEVSEARRRQQESGGGGEGHAGSAGSASAAVNSRDVLKRKREGGRRRRRAASAYNSGY
jgi:hypothetical protein